MSSRNTALKYLTATKIGEKGQLTVVKEFRKDLGLETGAPIAVLRLGMGGFSYPSNNDLSSSADKGARGGQRLA